MTTTMGVREVTRRTSEVFDRTSKGETIVVTNRGRLVGVISPPQAYSPELAELIAQGRVLPPAVPGGAQALAAMLMATGKVTNSSRHPDEFRDGRL